MTSSTALARTSRRCLVSVQPAPGPVRAVFVDGSNGVTERWGRAYPSSTPAVDELAAREFAATAIAARRAVADVPHGAVEVISDGILAVLVRHVLPGRAGVGPSVIVETSGSPAAFRDAVRRSDPLGTVVLAAPLTRASVDVATYADLHVRGVTVVGVPWCANPPDDETSSALVTMALDQLAHVTLDTPLPQAPWYRVMA